MLPLFDLSPDDVVADFGCGNGVLLELVAPRVREYVGVDFSEEFVRAAERRRDAPASATGRSTAATSSRSATRTRTGSTPRSRSISPSTSTTTSSCASSAPFTDRSSRARRSTAHAECRVLHGAAEGARHPDAGRRPRRCSRCRAPRGAARASAASRTSGSRISRTICMSPRSSMGSADCRSSAGSFERGCS